MDNSQLVVLEQFKHLDRQTKKRLDLKGSGRFEQTGSRNDIVEYLNELFWYAKSKGVSDIHFQSDAYGVNVRFRLNSMKMADYMHLSREDGEAVEKRLRSQSNISDAEKRLAHSSRFHMVRNQELLNIRISFQPTMFGQNIVCRLLGEAEELPLTDIAMNDALREQYIKALNSENGLILVSGPTGSGKTKTLMASIGYLNNNTKNLATVEDPVEIIAPGVNQTNVTPQLSFSEALRNILRQDPDIILVGETRDEETAKITVNAAFTGHLAFTSTHARNAPESIIRLIQLGAEPFELASAVLCFFSQRLLKRLCPYCCLIKQPREVPPTRFPVSTYAFVNPKGCSQCAHQGHIGRIPVFEMGFNTPEIRKAILHQDLETIKLELLKQQNYRTLAEAALELSAEGKVDFDDAVSLFDTTVMKV